jgi:hypothetical protein
MRHLALLVLFGAVVSAQAADTHAAREREGLYATP